MPWSTPGRDVQVIIPQGRKAAAPRAPFNRDDPRGHGRRPGLFRPGRTPPKPEPVFIAPSPSPNGGPEPHLPDHHGSAGPIGGPVKAPITTAARTMSRTAAAFTGRTPHLPFDHLRSRKGPVSSWRQMRSVDRYGTSVIDNVNFNVNHHVDQIVMLMRCGVPGCWHHRRMFPERSGPCLSRSGGLCGVIFDPLHPERHSGLGDLMIERNRDASLDP